jgi:hypothetical protein
MRADSVRLALACCTVWGVSGCARNPAPAGWLPTADGAQYTPFGSWIALEYKAAGDASLPAGGELIAVGRDSVFVVAPAGTVTAIPKAAVQRATVAAFDAQWGRLAVWTLVGSLSTLSHGVGLLISLPVWVIGGSLATASASRAPLHDDEPWQDVQKFARFSQGLPPGLDRATLRPTPGGVP